MASQDTPDQDTLLHEKLKEQITISISESLEKATTVLSSLHRVHSYLDVLKTMPSYRTGSGGGEGLKGVLEQVQGIRADAATLLQTIYLTEIGIQSLQDKHSCNTGVTVMPILEDSINSAGLNSSAINSNKDVKDEDMVLMLQRREVEGGEGGVSMEEEEDNGPPPKKVNVGAVITSCSGCNRRFATNQINGKCKNCRDGVPPPTTSSTQLPAIPAVLKIPLQSIKSPRPSFTSTPTTSTPATSTPAKTSDKKKKKRRGRKVSQPPVACKVCGMNFVYRRCLFRHLRENHPTIDMNNVHDYIEAGPVVPAIVPKSQPPLSETPPPSQDDSLNATAGSEVGANDIDASLDNNFDNNSMVEEEDEDDEEEEEEREAKEEEEEMDEGGGREGEREGEGEEMPDEQGGGEGGEGGQEQVMMRRVYTCAICNKMFDRPYRLQRHIQIHDPNRPRVNCQICDRSFTRMDTLENHLKSMHSDERPFACHYQDCTKSFAMQSSLINHLKVHTDGKPYKCLECDSSFSLLQDYKQHMRQEHADTEDLRCGDCYKVFPDSDHLEKHRLIEHRLECEVCGKTFARMAYLQMHIQIHSGDHVFNCKYCSCGFDTEYNYRQHLKTHPENQRVKKGFHCQVCDSNFDDPADLISHYRSQEHRDKATALGIGPDTTILNTIEAADFPDMNSLVDEVAMGTNPVAMGTHSDGEEGMIPSFTSQSEPADSISPSSVHTSQERLRKMVDQTL